MKKNTKNDAFFITWGRWMDPLNNLNDPHLNKYASIICTSFFKPTGLVT
jgi:hypothetical protein